MAILRKDGTFEFLAIKAGWGSSGHYSPEVLKRDGPNVFPAGTLMHANHATAAEEAARPEGDINTVMAVTTKSAAWKERGPSGPGLYSTAKAMPHFAEHIEALAPWTGVSIRALGYTESGEADGRTGPLVKELVAGKSIDLVTKAGAGGKILELFESARGAAPIVDAPSTGAVDPPLERSHTGMDEQEEKTLREAYAARESELQESRNRIKQLEEMQLMRQVQDLVSGELAAIEMPDMTRKRLGESLSQRPKLKEDGTIDVEGFRAHIRESVTAELRYLAEATGLGSGKIVGLGVSSLEEAEGQRAVESLERSFRKMGLSPEAAKLSAAGRG